jgi:hypothetical protein
MCIPSHAALLAPGEHRAFTDMMAPAATAPIPPTSTTPGATVPGSATREIPTERRLVSDPATAEEVLCHG